MSESVILRKLMQFADSPEGQKIAMKLYHFTRDLPGLMKGVDIGKVAAHEIGKPKGLYFAEKFRDLMPLVTGDPDGYYLPLARYAREMLYKPMLGNYPKPAALRAAIELPANRYAELTEGGIRGIAADIFKKRYGYPFEYGDAAGMTVEKSMWDKMRDIQPYIDEYWKKADLIKIKDMIAPEGASEYIMTNPRIIKAWEKSATDKLGRIYEDYMSRFHK